MIAHKSKQPTAWSTLLQAIKNRKHFEQWFFEFKNGHPFLLHEEAQIIIDTRLHDRISSWMNDEQIKNLVKIRVKAMYKRKFPEAKPWTLPIINNFEL